ncbi:MAG: RadC family protein [Bacillota bacterium]|uniref:RadC family protein n=1 Tax=Desulfurispora thermophila TaxID=265470 RepID=UPI000382E5CF|nr:DNA repair protein RadC [Desulfurispora thermophila]
MSYRVTVKDMPRELRPREKLLDYGVDRLSDSELLAIILRTGSREKSAIELAGSIIAAFGGLRQLLDVSMEELCAISGVGLAKAAQIKAALEVGRRVALSSYGLRPVIRSPQDAADMVMEEMRHLDREHFVALLLNTKNQVLAREVVSVGTLSSSAVHPRELFKLAIRRSAAAVILLHNHPSGDPWPSQEDIQVTHRLIEAGRIIGIEVLDHIVIGDNKYISLKAENLLA